MSSVIDRVAETFLQSRNEAIETYSKFVFRLAVAEDDENADVPSPDEVRQVLQASGKDIRDLRVDVRGYRIRMEQAEVAKTLPGLEDDLADVKRKIEKEAAAFEKVEQEYREKVRPLHYRVSDLNNEIVAARVAATNLINTCEDENRLLDYKRAERSWYEAFKLSEQHRKAMLQPRRIKADRAETRARDLEAQAMTDSKINARAAAARKEADELRVEIETAEREHVAAAQAAEKADQARKDALARMIEP